INFTYETHPKSTKQDDLAKQALETIQANIPGEFVLAFDKAPTEKNKARTVLEKHINNFISRNSFDYFIHKDLGGFLNRELDFYIKNEVLFIDDINTENPIYFTAQLSKIKALKTVANKIIAFLAQIEDFQKKLWLKKKFVISTNYCITLDRIPESYYPEIVANQAQLEEWKVLFDVEITDVSQLVFEQFLVLDTKHFSQEFKDKLLAEFYDLDEETDGLLINSENFQALGLIKEKEHEKVNIIYIDPPYNTGKDGFIYKDGFSHSSWLSMIESRVYLTKSLLSNTGVCYTSVDDHEFSNLKGLSDTIWDEKNFVADLIWANQEGGGSSDSKLFRIKHEHILTFSKFKELVEVSGVSIGNEERYKSSDEFVLQRGKYYLQKLGMGSIQYSEKLDYPISAPDGSIIMPADNNSGKKACWRWSKNKFDWGITNGFIEIKKDSSGIWTVYTKQYFNCDNEGNIIERSQRPMGIINEFSSTQAAKLLDSLGIGSIFSYAKPVDLIKYLIARTDKKSVCILDYFAGSGTTGHSAIKLNREDGGKRKYILVEMGTYFNNVTKPRIQKVIYSDNWKNGKPQDKAGISQIFKYQVLESYEDTLNNLSLQTTSASGLLQFNQEAQEEYLLSYMLDVESEGHLFNLEAFKNPFAYQLNVTENNELVPTTVDLVETFNYLIGLYVQRMQRVKDIKLVEGKTRTGEKTLVIWRNLETTSNEETEKVFRKLYDSVRSAEFDQIYINGDHHFENVRTGDDQFKVKLIEESFFKLMFNQTEL
ncbi:MAG: site-specific DNA-methyltransferase, partial [Fluviicola sp.]|nr:site-specific DNA-methyltransferase [Fluviicola sp.]